MREAFARREADLRAGHDLVVVARPDALELAEREGLAGLDAALCELLGRAGLNESQDAATESADGGDA